MGCSEKFRILVPGFHNSDGLVKRFFQNPPADGPKHEPQQAAHDVFALSYDDHINAGLAVGQTSEGIGVTGRGTPDIRVRRREDDAIRMGPIVL